MEERRSREGGRSLAVLLVGALLASLFVQGANGRGISENADEVAAQPPR